mgnify:CR=1 FL=1
MSFTFRYEKCGDAPKYRTYKILLEKPKVSRHKSISASARPLTQTRVYRAKFPPTVREMIETVGWTLERHTHIDVTGKPVGVKETLTFQRLVPFEPKPKRKK